ncbi:porin [Endozoicomonas sp. ONNA2]|uniref:porin n=1 Tax=Endozoicomonas sp. ONNA2 TaxID=2828741 RepID=UPI0021497D7A|nr:porin [Endozoicomonas sp. ONNA2]
MKRTILAVAISTASTLSFAGDSYITGNVQHHSEPTVSGSRVTSTIEAGHTFATTERGGLTVLAEIDGIKLGDNAATNAAGPYLTLGFEQAYNINEKLWVAAGYQHVLQDGDSISARPLVKIGYHFGNGVSISNRTRLQLDQTDLPTADDDVRTDNAIGYQLPAYPVQVKYNNVYMWDTEKMDHEFRATWTRNGVQPYAEWRNQSDRANNAMVFGATVSF